MAKIKINWIYGKPITFEYSGKLPQFKEYCDVRTQIAQDKIEPRLHSGIPHLASDFVVEHVRSDRSFDEIWEMGS